MIRKLAATTPLKNEYGKYKQIAYNAYIGKVQKRPVKIQTHPYFNPTQPVTIKFGPIKETAPVINYLF